MSAAACAAETAKPCCLGWDGAVADQAAVAGAVERGALGCVVAVGALWTVVPTRHGGDWVYVRAAAAGAVAGAAAGAAAAAYAGAVRDPAAAAAAAG